jgi:hypothetical protein
MPLASPYLQIPKPLEQQQRPRSRQAEEREYARALSGALHSKQGAGFTASVLRPSKQKAKQRPASALPWDNSSSGGLGVLRRVGSAGPKRPPAAFPPSPSPAEKQAAPLPKAPPTADEVEATRRERAATKLAAHREATNGALVDRLLQADKRNAWTQKQLARCSTQLAQMRARVSSVGRQQPLALADCVG